MISLESKTCNSDRELRHELLWSRRHLDLLLNWENSAIGPLRKEKS